MIMKYFSLTEYIFSCTVSTAVRTGGTSTLPNTVRWSGLLSLNLSLSSRPSQVNKTTIDKVDLDYS